MTPEQLQAKVNAMPEGERPTAKLLLKRIDELLEKHPGRYRDNRGRRDGYRAGRVTTNGRS